VARIGAQSHEARKAIMGAQLTLSQAAKAWARASRLTCAFGVWRQPLLDPARRVRLPEAGAVHLHRAACPPINARVRLQLGAFSVMRFRLLWRHCGVFHFHHELLASVEGSTIGDQLPARKNGGSRTDTLRRCIKAISKSKARAPTCARTPSASNSRCAGRTSIRPNSSDSCITAPPVRGKYARLVRTESDRTPGVGIARWERSSNGAGCRRVPGQSPSAKVTLQGSA